MAVEGSHDSKVFLRQVKSFRLSASLFTEIHNQTFNLLNKLSLTFTSENDNITLYNKYVYQRTNSGIIETYYFEKNPNGVWALKVVENDGGSKTSSEITIAGQNSVSNPYEIDFSGETVGSAFVGASIGSIQTDFRKLKSIKNIAFSQEVQEENVQVLGDDLGFKSIIGPTQTRVAVDKTLNSNDFIRNLAGRSDILGQFEYGDNAMRFVSGCINNFSVNATINEIPQTSFDLTIYGSLSPQTTLLPSFLQAEDNDPEEAKVEELTVTFDKNSTNAVQAFSFSEVFNKQAFYQIGQNEPSDIKTIGTIQQEVAIDIEVEDYEIEETFSFLSETKDRDRTIKLEIGNPVQNTYQLQNASLVSESIALGVGGTPVASLIYRGYRE